MDKQLILSIRRENTMILIIQTLKHTGEKIKL